MKTVLGLFLLAFVAIPAKADYIDPCPVDGALWGDGRTINCGPTAPRNIDQTPGNIQVFWLTSSLLTPQSSLTINTSTGKVIDADIYLSEITLDLFYILRQGVGEVLLMSNAPGGGSGAWIDLHADTDSFVDYRGGLFTATAGPGLPNMQGSITPMPETSSAIMLLIGLLLIAGLAPRNSTATYRHKTLAPTIKH